MVSAFFATLSKGVSFETKCQILFVHVYRFETGEIEA